MDPPGFYFLQISQHEHASGAIRRKICEATEERMTDRAGPIDSIPSKAGMPRHPTIPGKWLALQLALSGLIAMTLMMRTGLKVIENRTLIGVSIAMSAAALVRYIVRRSHSPRHQRLRDFAEYLVLFSGTSLFGVLASYPAAALTVGFDDPILDRVDKALHFDWVAWYIMVANHTSLQIAGSVAYAAIYVSPLLILGHLAWTGQRSAARKFLVTFWLAVLLTLALFPVFPAEGPLAFLWHGSVPYMPTSALYMEHIIPDLRGHSVTNVDLGSLRGLVCAPSFHTVSAALYIHTAWPVRRLRWPLTLINLAMLLAIPVEGTHYLADMIVGLLVAILAIGIVRTSLYILWRQWRKPEDIPSFDSACDESAYSLPAGSLVR
ncbi:phosphatase PAP2 family protein [Novosphingobium sp. G106]|uniref:phosphatase PAP2 family protein n=1 Tax=Novosphingobium sp. G106 TaxID=2849500 RepID=UPI001C2DC53B|nr:phosphatase PAP2 family protein [Novosphingobium sp. G106]MBV1691014.1 phosphatase PAP2 family protein [Novosphingobium sp. G106]